MVQSIHCNGDRVYAGDMADSMVFMKYKRAENALVSFADDLCGRHLTATAYVDYSTVVGADKFGNVFILRLPKVVSTVLLFRDIFQVNISFKTFVRTFVCRVQCAIRIVWYSGYCCLFCLRYCLLW